jgi:hypothetical protein
VDQRLNKELGLREGLSRSSLGRTSIGRLDMEKGNDVCRENLLPRGDREVIVSVCKHCTHALQPGKDENPLPPVTNGRFRLNEA